MSVKGNVGSLYLKAKEEDWRVLVDGNRFRWYAAYKLPFGSIDPTLYVSAPCTSVPSSQANYIRSLGFSLVPITLVTGESACTIRVDTRKFTEEELWFPELKAISLQGDFNCREDARIPTGWGFFGTTWEEANGHFFDFIGTSLPDSSVGGDYIQLSPTEHVIYIIYVDFPGMALVSVPTTCNQVVQVKNEDTNAPMAGVRMAAEPYVGTIIKCTTGSDGRCTLVGLKEGDSYTLKVEVIPSGFECSFPSDCRTTITACESEKLFLLKPEVVPCNQPIRVVNKDTGVGIANVRVYASGATYEECTTDSGGRCTLPSLKKGTTYNIGIKTIPGGYGCQFPDDCRRNVVVCTSEEKLSLKPITCSQVVQVKNEDTNAPMAGVRMAAEPYVGTIIKCTTGSDGRCTLPGLTKGDSYTLKVDIVPDGYKCSFPSDCRTAITACEVEKLFLLKPEVVPCNQVVQVKNEDTNAPMAGVRMAAEPYVGTIIKCTTGSDGRCTLVGLKEGDSYTLKVDIVPDGYKCSFPSDCRTAITACEVEKLFLLKPEAVPCNQGVLVKNEDTNAPMAGVRMAAEPYVGTIIKCTTGSDGRCTLPGLTKGDSYTLKVEVIPSGFECSFPSDCRTAITACESEKTFLLKPEVVPTPTPLPTPPPKEDTIICDFDILSPEGKEVTNLIAGVKYTVRVWLCWYKTLLGIKYGGCAEILKGCDSGYEVGGREVVFVISGGRQIKGTTTSGGYTEIPWTPSELEVGDLSTRVEFKGDASYNASVTDWKTVTVLGNRIRADCTRIGEGDDVFCQEVKQVGGRWVYDLLGAGETKKVTADKVLYFTEVDGLELGKYYSVIAWKWWEKFIVFKPLLSWVVPDFSVLEFKTGLNEIDIHYQVSPVGNAVCGFFGIDPESTECGLFLAEFADPVYVANTLSVILKHEDLEGNPRDPTTLDYVFLPIVILGSVIPIIPVGKITKSVGLFAKYADDSPTMAKFFVDNASIMKRAIAEGDTARLNIFLDHIDDAATYADGSAGQIRALVEARNKLVSIIDTPSVTSDVAIKRFSDWFYGTSKRLDDAISMTPKEEVLKTSALVDASSSLVDDILLDSTKVEDVVENAYSSFFNVVVNSKSYDEALETFVEMDKVAPNTYHSTFMGVLAPTKVAGNVLPDIGTSRADKYLRAWIEATEKFPDIKDYFRANQGLVEEALAKGNIGKLDEFTDAVSRGDRTAAHSLVNEAVKGTPTGSVDNLNNVIIETERALDAADAAPVTRTTIKEAADEAAERTWTRVAEVEADLKRVVDSPEKASLIKIFRRGGGRIFKRLSGGLSRLKRKAPELETPYGDLYTTLVKDGNVISQTYKMPPKESRSFFWRHWKWLGAPAAAAVILVPWWGVDNAVFMVWMGREFGWLEPGWGLAWEDAYWDIKNSEKLMEEDPCNYAYQGLYVDALERWGALLQVDPVTEEQQESWLYYYKVAWGVEPTRPREALLETSEKAFKSADERYYQLTQHCLDPLEPSYGMATTPLPEVFTAFKVHSVIDGDTILVIPPDEMPNGDEFYWEHGETIETRLVGINTPESGKYKYHEVPKPWMVRRQETVGDGIEHPELEEQWVADGALWEEIRNWMVAKVGGYPVTLKSDLTRQYDKYDRFVARVEKDGEDVGKTELRLGYAPVFFYDSNKWVNTADYLVAEQVAKNANIGVWPFKEIACTCSFDAASYALGSDAILYYYDAPVGSELRIIDPDGVTDTWVVSGTDEKTKRLNKVGAWRLTLSGTGCSVSDTVQVFEVVCPKPTANFSVLPSTSVGVGDVVTFLDDSSGGDTKDIKSRFWTFGDGGTSSLLKPTHIYGAEGKFTVRLVVENECGETDDYSKEMTVKLITPPPPPEGKIHCKTLKPDNSALSGARIYVTGGVYSNQYFGDTEKTITVPVGTYSIKYTHTGYVDDCLKTGLVVTQDLTTDATCKFKTPAPTPSPTPPPPSGTLTINSYGPDCVTSYSVSAFIVDDIDKGGGVALTVSKLAVGTHKVEIHDDKYASYYVAELDKYFYTTEAFYVDVGEVPPVTIINVCMTTLRVLLFTSKPLGARVYLKPAGAGDEAYIDVGISPITYELALGDYIIKYVMDGFSTLIASITVEDDKIICHEIITGGVCSTTEPITPPGLYVSLFLLRAYLKEVPKRTVRFDSVPPNASIEIEKL